MNNIPGVPNLFIGSIYCIGRNYAKHAKEMGSAIPDEPMIFLKPASSIIGNDETIILPSQSNNVHHEVELVIAISKKGKNISLKHASEYIAGYGIGIDVTARDIQQEAKDRGHPWSVAKGFDTFAPISNFLPMDETTDFNMMDISLAVNSEIRQKGTTKNMIFSVEQLIAYLSTIFTLHPGDIIFTGTPEGVSPIETGDVIEAHLNKNEIALTISVD